MGRSWEAATLTNSAANFVNPAPVYDPHTDFYYQAFHQNEDLFIKEYRLKGADTVHVRVEKVDYIVGSGQHTNSHIMNVGGYLYQMPMTWYTQDGKWDLPPGFKGDGNNSRFDRPIPLKCITCHNAMPSYIQGSENKYDAVPHGIDCERCHGPGSLHIEALQTGQVEMAMENIVNPGTLPIDLQFDICQGCHMQGAAVSRNNKSFADFRPGERLLDIENVFWPRYADSLQQFVMASHPDRLKLSVCFQESRRRKNTTPLTCITCHDPHVSIETLGPNHYRQTCQGCHGTSEERMCTATESMRAAKENNCVACHMPVSGSADIPHVRITDHLIRSPGSTFEQLLSPEEVETKKQFIRLASLLDASPPAVEIARGYLTYYEEITNHPGFLDSAAVYLEKARKETSLEEVAIPLIRLYFLQKDYAAIIRLASSRIPVEDAWTAYRIGDAFLAVNAPSQAISYLEQATQLAPSHLRFLTRLALAYSQNNRLTEAILLLDRVLMNNPKFTEAYNNRGFAYLHIGNLENAESDFLAALALDPDLEQALGNLASLYYNTDRKNEALPYARRLLERNANHPQYRLLWEALHQ